jgi:hypothetical protein
LNGNNYLLPVDIDIPRTEADIQLAGLKVDDLGQKHWVGYQNRFSGRMSG